MPEIRKPAVKLQQGDLSLFLTAFTMRDFVQDGFYCVDRLDVAESEGMQRLLEKSRIKRFGSDISEAYELGEALLPTSVFLATKGEIEYDEGTREIIFDGPPNAGTCPFDVVDGQHRIEGLRVAANRTGNHSLMDFPVATVIATGLDEAARMLQFIVVNTKQKKVGPDVAQHIISRFTKMDGVQELPYIPGWLRKEIDKGDIDIALEFAKRLNRDNDSPLRGRIQMADERRAHEHTVNQQAFVNLITKFTRTAAHPLESIGRDIDHRLALMKNFWKAVEQVFVGEYDSHTSVFTANSIEFFLQILAPVLNQLVKRGNYTVDDFATCIRSANDYISPKEYAGILSPDYWKTSGSASALNASGMQKMATAYNTALAEANSQDDEIKV